MRAKKLVLSMFVLALVSSSFGAGEILIGNFENSMDGWWKAGWSTGDSATPVQMYATVGEWSMKVTMGAGGWDNTIEGGFLGSPTQVALSTVGKVIVDVTTLAADFPESTASLGLLVNTGNHVVDPDTGAESWPQTKWDVYDWQTITVGGTTTLTFQLTADVMAIIGSATGWANIGFISNTAASIPEQIDPETGELLSPAVIPTYYFDNIQIVPEPATMILLGFGGLSVIRRKR